MIHFFRFFTFLFLMSSVFADNIQFTFHKWEEEESQKYAQSVIDGYKNLNEASIKSAQERVIELRHKKDFGALAKELERLFGKTPESFNLWLEVATAYASKALESEDTWEWQRNGKHASIKAFSLAKTDTEKAEALLIYAECCSEWSDDRKKILTLFSSTEVFKKVKSDPRFKDFLNFKYTNYTLNKDQKNPEVSFHFNEKIDSSQSIEDFVESSPKVDVKMRVVENSIVIKGLNFGTSYDFTIKPGIKSRFGDELASPVKIGVKVTDQSSQIRFKSQQYILQKSENLQVPVELVNIEKIHVQILRVSDQVVAGLMTQNYTSFLRNISSYDFKHLEKVESHKIFEGDMEIKGQRNQERTLGIPLGNAIKNQKPGVYVIAVSDKGQLEKNTSPEVHWVMVTDTGLTTFQGKDGLHVNVRSLSGAKSQKGMKIDLISHNQTILASKISDAEGRVFFDAPLLQGKDGNRPLMLATYGEGSDFSILDLTKTPLDLSDLPTTGLPTKHGEDIYVYTDRGIFRPGESIHFHGILRNPQLQGIAGATLTFKLLKPDGLAFKEEQITGNDVGLFEHNFQLLESSPTGLWAIQGFVDPKDKTPLFETKISVEDFTPAKILVKVKADMENLSADSTLTAHVHTEYLFGGKVGDLNAEAVALFEKAHNPFPIYKDYAFGDTLEDTIPERVELPLSALDEKGEAILALDGHKIKSSSMPLRGILRVNVFDRGGRPQLGTVRFNVFTQPEYIGIQKTVEHVDGDAKHATFSIIAVSKDAELQKVEKCTWTLLKEQSDYTWYQSDGTWRYNVIRSTDILNEGTFTLSGTAPTPLTVDVGDAWGDYILEVKDTVSGMTSKIRFTKGWGRGDRIDVPDLLKIRLDKEVYKKGDDATLQIQSPFDGEALLTVASGKGIIQQTNISVKRGENTHTLKVTDGFGVGAYILVNAFRPLSNDATLQALPLRAMGLAWCGMDMTEKTLPLTLQAPPLSKPRETFEVEVSVDEKAYKSKTPLYLTLAAVDEGILLLTDYKTPDPLKHFFGKKEFPLEIRDVYAHIIQSAISETGAFHTGGDEGALAKNLAALSKRSFKLVSLYSGMVFLQNGKAKIPFAIPDFNGKVRIMGVIASKDKVGAAQISIQVKDPLVVEAILPPFLAPKDKSQLILSIHNQTGKDEELTVSLSAKGPLKLEKNELHIKMEKDKEQVFTIPMVAENEAGDAEIIVHVKGSGNVQIYTHSLSIREGLPIKTRFDAAYLEQGKQVTVSESDFDGFIREGARISLAIGYTPWNAEKMAKDLVTYPYGCVEQTVSKGFGLLYLKSQYLDFAQKAGEKKGDEKIDDKEKGKKEKIDTDINAIIAKIAQDQGVDGFTLWPGESGNKGEKLHLNAYVYDFLSEAKKQGFIVPHFTMKNLEDLIRQGVINLSQKSDEKNMKAASYALCTLIKAGVVEPGAVRAFFDGFFDLLQSPFARACVIHALSHFDTDTRLTHALNTFSFKSEDLQKESLADNLKTLKILSDAAHLNPSIREKLQTNLIPFVSMIKGRMKDYTSFSTEEKSWMTRTHPMNTGDVTVNVDSQKIIKKHAIFFDYHAKDMPHMLENLGITPLWMSKIISGHLKDPKTEAQGITLKRTYMDMEGKAINPTTLTQGQLVLCLVDGSITDPMDEGMERTLLLVEMLPGGVVLDPLSRISWLSDLTPTVFSSMRDDRYVASFKLDNKTKDFKIAYLMRAVTLGTYLAPGGFIEDMTDPRVFAQNTAVAINVVERGK